MAYVEYVQRPRHRHIITARLTDRGSDFHPTRACQIRALSVLAVHLPAALQLHERRCRAPVVWFEVGGQVLGVLLPGG